MKNYLLLLVISVFIFSQQAPVFARSGQVQIDHTVQLDVQQDYQQLLTPEIFAQMVSNQKQYSELSWLWSVFIPGVSQFVLDEPEKGWLMAGSFTGVYFSRMLLMFATGGYLPMLSGTFGGFLVLGIMVAIHIWSVIDAILINIEKTKTSHRLNRSIQLTYKPLKPALFKARLL